MKKKKITAIMAVIMMAAGLSACSQSNAKLEGKSGIVKDEASKTEGDTSVVDQAPATYVQDAEYVNKDDIVSVDDTIEINGITYKIEKYEHTTEFGNRNKDTVLDYLKDLYGEACNGVQREHNKKLNNGLPILHKVPPKRDYGRYFCIMAEKGGTSHGGLTEKLSPFFHAKKQEVNAYGR